MGFVNWLLRIVGLAPERGAPVRRPASATTSSSSPAAPGAATTPAQPKSRTLAHLDAGQFAPLSDAEMHRQARGLGSIWSNPWFGRRDLIPPVSDKRTALIDRGMVAHGLITPEELAEIHAVGEEMDRVRPDIATAKVRADEEVARSEEERKALKERKKAEAAERRRQRAEAVAHRRQTDIVFLGRGVSKGLAGRTADVEKLRAQDLPVLATPADVAQALELSIPRLRWLAFDNPAATRTHYVRFTVPKRGGGVRELSAPHRDLARCQEWILRNILAKVPAHDAAHGFVVGRNTLSGARLHAGADVVVNCDLRDFFPSITFPRVDGVFRQLGYSPAAATVLALLCTESPRRTVEYAGRRYHVAAGPRALPQGACTSPALSNLVVRRFDSRLTGLAAKLGWRYTRYADDLSFSASGEAAQMVGYLLARVRHVAADEGFAVNEAKTRAQRRNTAQSVTGIVVNERPGIPRRTVRRLRAILHRAKSEGLAAQNRDGHPNFEAWVEGMVAYVQMVNPEQARPLREALAGLRS